MSPRRAALATSSELRDLTPDDRLLAAELQRRGIGAAAVVWDDPTTRWDGFDAVVLRSCWDYHLRTPEFEAWLDRLDAGGARVWNPTSLVRWNLHKSYLRDLSAQGVPVLPTVWVPRGRAVRLEAILAENGWERAVIKPAVSASAYGTWVVDTRDAPASGARFAALADQGDVLVQRFERALVERGEWSFVHFGGRYSHAVLKTPRRDDFRVQEEYGGSSVSREPPRSLLEQCDRILSHVEGPWLFARVDGVDLSGTFTLMELELIEPVLFLASAPGAAARLVDAIERVL